MAITHLSVNHMLAVCQLFVCYSVALGCQCQDAIVGVTVGVVACRLFVGRCYGVALGCQCQDAIVGVTVGVVACRLFVGRFYGVAHGCLSGPRCHCGSFAESQS